MSVISNRGRISARRLLEAWTGLIAVLSMGSLYFQVLRMPLTAALLLTTSFLWVFTQKSKIRKSNIAIFCAITCIFLLTSFFNLEYGFHVNDVIIWAAYVMFVIILQSNMTFRKFTELFVKVMIVEATISIICFVYADILGGNLPLLHLEANKLNGFYLTPYYTLGWLNIPVFMRNAGWFHEPGAHQIFLNFALLFLFNDPTHYEIKKRRYVLSVLILIAAIFTTLSTTGYICFAVVCLSITLKDNSKKDKLKFKIVALVLIVVLGLIEAQTGVVQAKIMGRNLGGSFNTRYNDTFGGFAIALKRPFLGYGLYAENLNGVLNAAGITNISNGLASFMIGVGPIIAIFWLIFMLINFKRKLNSNWLFTLAVYVLYLLSINSEAIMLNLLFLTFIGIWQPEKQYIQNTDNRT